jgi:hypothetical protein
LRHSPCCYPEVSLENAERLWSIIQSERDYQTVVMELARVDVDLLRLRQLPQKDMQHAERPACVRHAAATYSFRVEDRARAFAVMNEAPCGDRTHDHTLTKRMLYQLS